MATGSRTALALTLVCAIALCAVPDAGARSKRLPIPNPSAGDGTIVQSTFTLRPKRAGGKVKGRPGLKLARKAGAQQLAVGAIKKLKRNTYRATVMLFQKKGAPASGAASPRLRAVVVAPAGTTSAPWVRTTGLTDVFRNYLDLLRKVSLEDMALARLAKLANLKLTTLKLRQIFEAIEALADQEATTTLSTLVGSLGGRLPAGFGAKKTTPLPTATLAVDHSITGPTTTLCAHVTTSQTQAGTSASVTVTRLDDKAQFGPKTFWLDENGSGMTQFEINPSDTLHTDLAVTTIDGVLKAAADGIGPLVSTAVCPPSA